MKKSNPIKNLIPFISVGTVILGLLGGWFKFQAMAENTKVRVDKVEDKVEKLTDEGGKEIDKLKEETGKLEKSIEVNKVQQDAIQREVQQIADKSEKIYEAIIQMQKKK